MGIPENHPAILEAKRRGLIADFDAKPVPLPTAPASKPRRKAQLVQSWFIDDPLTWLLPIVTASEANGRDWRARSNRTQQARRIVSAALGFRLPHLAKIAEHYHWRQGHIRVSLTRIGARKLDAANLGPALKATEDAVALMLGADDGDTRWHAEFHQQVGGLVGVRIAITELGVLT